jgi:hypothetical protein
MAATGPTPGEHLAKARQYLQQVEGVANTDPQVKATAAVAHAVLALAEQVAIVRHQTAPPTRQTPPGPGGFATGPQGAGGFQ